MTLPGKTPFWVRCGDCKHEWVAFYTPILLSLMERFGDVCCPQCASKNVLCGRSAETAEKA